jgi:di- and tripeptidase
MHTFECYHGAVLSLVARGDTIFAGCQDGYIKVWDLETKTLVREIIVQEVRTHSLKHLDFVTIEKLKVCSLSS